MKVVDVRFGTVGIFSQEGLEVDLERKLVAIVDLG